jgi:pimeloyl-ACP methyl ester carboxylesterase
MTTFVLVHGAWHGAWAWERTIPFLREAGAHVRTPELTFHEATGLDDHVEQVVAELEQAGTDRDLVLVGHSYAGLVVRQAADRRPDLVDHIVLLEGWAGQDGASLMSLAPDWFVQTINGIAVDGMLPPVPVTFLGINDPEDVQWASQRMRAHPLRTFTDQTRLTGAVNRVQGTAIVGTSEGYPFAALARDLGYPVVSIDGPHDVMITAPSLVADVLLRVTEQQWSR